MLTLRKIDIDVVICTKLSDKFKLIFHLNGLYTISSGVAFSFLGVNTNLQQVIKGTRLKVSNALISAMHGFHQPPTRL